MDRKFTSPGDKETSDKFYDYYEPKQKKAVFNIKEAKSKIK